MASDDFASRAAKLFGSLESHGATGVAWNLNTQQGFAAGAEDQDSSEDGEAGPQCLPGAAGSDEDEEEYKAKASLQYCAAFEAEEEEDAFDLVAAGDGEQEASAQLLQKNMQVLDDNAFERSHHQPCHQAEQQQQQQQGTVRAPLPQQQQRQPAGEAMDVEVEGAALPHQPADAAARTTAKGVTDPHTGKAAAATHGAEQQQQQQCVRVTGGVEDSVQQEGVKRVKPRGGVWVPPHRRPENRPPEQDMQDLPHQQEPARQQQQQQLQPRGRRRVTFSDDAGHGSHEQQQQQGHRLPPPGGRGRGGAGAGACLTMWQTPTSTLCMSWMSHCLWAKGVQMLHLRQWQAGGSSSKRNGATRSSSSSSSSGRPRPGTWTPAVGLRQRGLWKHCDWSLMLLLLPAVIMQPLLMW